MVKPIATEIVEAINTASDRGAGAVLKIKHSACSEHKDEAMKIYRKADGWYFHCFRCSYQGFVSDDNQSPEELKARWEKLKAQKSYEAIEKIVLPADFVLMDDSKDLGIPHEAWHWFWQYHLTSEHIRKYGIGWSDAYQRVIVPCRTTAILKPSNDFAYDMVGWIGREVYCQSKTERKRKNIIKYLTKKAKGIKHMRFHAPANTDTIVLVEDVISAIKIREFTGTDALALLTTHIPVELVLALKHKKILIWLDGDMLAKSVGYVQKFSQLGCDVGHIHTPLDPKEYVYQELMDQLFPLKEE